MITIIDYGVGNIKAFENIFRKLDFDVNIARTETELGDPSKLILPGVGHFDYAMKRFTESGMLSEVTNLVINKKVPILGICVGMQMLSKKSEEGALHGLGWIDAQVKKIDISTLHHSTRLPHMGWNNIRVIQSNPLLSGLESDSRFYFLHSYIFQCNSQQDIIATANYGNDFTCVVNYNNIYGVQFHPEKSHHFGIQLLKNFALI